MAVLARVGAAVQGPVVPIDHDTLAAAPGIPGGLDVVMLVLCHMVYVRMINSLGTVAAAAHLQAGEWAEAVELLRGVVAENPDDGLSWIRLGRGLIELDRAQEALDALDRSEAAGFQSPFVGIFRARAFARMSRTGEALSALEAIAPSPAVGGGATIDTISDFRPLADEPRFAAVVQAMEQAAWPCRDNEVSREFDYWIGTWDVYVQGQQAGTNVVERMLGGCTLLENWTNVRGREGKSFNWVDRSTFREHRWRQLWVADGGNTLDYYNGHYSDGAMRFEGHTFTPAGDSMLDVLLAPE